MSSYLLRVLLPDRPGSLGAFTTALGGAGVDIVSLEIVERAPGHAVDDLVVQLPPGALADRILTAAHSVEDVVVESLRPFHGAFDTSTELELVESLAALPSKAHALLADALPGVFRASWTLVLAAPRGVTTDGGDLADDAPVAAVLAASAAAPEIGTLALPFRQLDEAVRLDEEADWVPPLWRTLGTALAAAPLGASGCVALVGRTGGPVFLDSELLRLGHLASIVGMVATAAGG